MAFEFDSTGSPVGSSWINVGFDFDADGNPLQPRKPTTEGSDLGRGFKESFQQLPQLGYGLMAGAGAAAESAFGEGGIATGIKKAGIEGYKTWGDKIAKDAKPSDSWDYSYDQAKQGNFGALVDWLQHGIGYVGGQAVQTLATAGIGAIGGKFVASTAAKEIAAGMVAKEAANIAGTTAAKDLTADAITKLATANVAAKFANIGQSVAVGANAFGMEGGEIFGDLTSTNKDRALTGSEIGKAFAATLGAGALEFVGDKVGLDIMLGKSKLLKPTEFMPGMAGRAARGSVAAAGAAPIEAGTEFAQTLAEEYGKGNDPFGADALKQAKDAAALGALGGAVVGGAGGTVHGAKPRPNSIDAQSVTAPLQIGNAQDPLIGFPDGTVAHRSEVDAYIAGLPEDQRAAVRAKMMGLGPQAETVNPIQSILSATSVDEAIEAAQAAGQAWQAIAPTQPAEDLAMQRQLAQAEENLAQRALVASEREGAARSVARDERLKNIGQEWQSLGITNPQDDLQAQRAGMRPTPDGTTDGTQSGAIAGVQPSSVGATPNLDAGTGTGVRDGDNSGRVAADRVGELYQQQPSASALGFPYVKNESGTVFVSGDPAAIRSTFPGLIGATKFTDGQPAGVLFGTSAAPSVLAKLEQQSVQNTAPRTDTEAKATPAQAPAPEGSKPVAAAGVPVTGVPAVQADGVKSADQPLVQKAKRAPVAEKQAPVVPKTEAVASAVLGKEVSRYNGKFGKGMGRDAARLEAQRLNRINTDKTVTYTAEEHNDPKLENPYVVVGRKFEPKSAKTESRQDGQFPSASAADADQQKKPEKPSTVQSQDSAQDRGQSESKQRTVVGSALGNVTPDTDSKQDPVSEAKPALDAANVTGKERLDVIKDLKSGVLTAEEVKEAYSEKADAQEKNGVMLSRGTKEPMPAFDNASGNYNPDLDPFWLKKAAQEINGDGMPEAEYHQAIAEYANKWRVDDLLEKLGWKSRGSSNISSSRYYTKQVGIGDYDAEYGGYDEYKTYEIRVSDHDDRHPASVDVERRFQVNFRDGSESWSDADIGPDLSNKEAMERLESILPKETMQDVPAAKRLGYARYERNNANGDAENTTTNEPTAPASSGAFRRNPFGTPTTVTALQSAIKELTGLDGFNRLGRIVATTASEIKSTWEPLIGQSVNIESEGDAGAAQGFYDPKSKTIFLIADNIREGAETAVLAHELMHKYGQQVLGKEGWDRLHSAISSWENADRESDEWVVYNYARNKVEAVGAELSNQELFPYAVEAALNMGIKPDLKASRGTVARWLESVRQSLKMVWDKITGKPETFKAQDMVNLAFGIAQMENPANRAEIQGFQNNGLQEFSKLDDLYALPKSKAKDIEQIARDNGEEVKVRTTDLDSEKLHTVTFKNGTEIRITERPANPYGQENEVYGMELEDGDARNTQVGRPGENPEDVPPTDDVWLDVSQNTPATLGAKAYNIAATFAYNNGKIFIGDPAGLSDKALRRRTEQMLSSALKFGTTEHIAPHPRQVAGDAALGIPPLKWVYGDHVGNIERMIDVSLQSLENGAPGAQDDTRYDPSTGRFTDKSGEVVSRKSDMGRGMSAYRAGVNEAQAGWRTLARAAFWRSFLGPNERAEGSGILDRAGADVAGLASTGPDGSNYPASERVFYSRSAIVGQTNRQHTPEQLRAMKNVGFQVEVPTLKERAQVLWKDAGKKLAQGIVDQFAPVKDLDKNAYGLLRLAKGASGAFEAFLQGGKLKLTDGVYDFDDANKGGVIDRLLIPLQGEHHDFFRWVAANRAERLAGEGKENLFSAQDIADLKTLADGVTDFDYTIQTGPAKGRVTRDRTLIYADANRVFNEFNRNVLDMAEQSGLIDGESRKVWEHEFYVPFYRVADEDGGGVRGMSVKGSVLRQQAFKELKGGKNALNSDLLDNTLMNWAHLLDASAKNRAAKATIEAAERMGVASPGNQSTLVSMGASVHNKNGVVWFMDGGQKRYSLIDNTGDGPYLMTAINALEYAGMRNPVMNAMGAMKHALTVGVTASPFFKIRNLIRDSVQAIGTANLSYNPVTNIAEGWKLTDPKSDAYFRLLAGGGTIHFGSMLEGSEAKRVQALVESGVDDATILNGDKKIKAFYRKFIEPGVTAYNELGNRVEAINRASLYDQLRKQGLSHADASLQARDLMDFSMQGAWTGIRFLTQVVPFFNARIQGLYKLGKSAKEDPARFATVLGAAAAVSIGLLAAYGDDDDWKKREEWDRNNFWWFKFGGTAFRIPKPFEIGAIATLAERGFELAFDKEMTNKRFMNQVMTLLGDNLSMNPVPQLVKPMLDVYANKDSFSGRPIETMGMDRLKSEYRFTDRTSMTARGISTGLNSVTGLVGAEALSPVQIDSMLRGYFGWLGSFVIGAADVVARPATGQAEHPSSDLWKAATGGMVSDLQDAPSRYVSQMYTQAREIEQAYGTWRSLLKEGKTAEAQEFATDNRDILGKYRNIETVKRTEAKLNERIRMIERSDMDADTKRDLIRSIQQQKNRIALLAA